MEKEGLEATDQDVEVTVSIYKPTIRTVRGFGDLDNHVSGILDALRAANKNMAEKYFPRSSKISR